MYKLTCVFLITFSFAFSDGQESVEHSIECIPNRVYKVDCNTCICTANRKLGLCTLAACPQGENECQAGETKIDKCSSCFCHVPSHVGKSVFACTDTCAVPLAREKRAVRECTVGDFKYNDCNPCTCTEDEYGNTSWSCTRKFCLPRERRDVNVASDFKDTPCAPNDIFTLPNCITCYCNSARTGYLCSDKVCPGDDNITETDDIERYRASKLPVEYDDNKTPNELHESLNEDVIKTKPSSEAPGEIQDVSEDYNAAKIQNVLEEKQDVITESTIIETEYTLHKDLKSDESLTERTATVTSSESPKNIVVKSGIEEN